MTWFKVDDGFYDHPKFLDVPNAAIGLWTKSGAWCGKHLTDGVIPASQVKRFKGTKSQINALVSAGIWVEDRSENGAKVFRFHDWNGWQPSREQKLKEREEAAERQRKSRHRKRQEQGEHENVTRDSHVTGQRDIAVSHRTVSHRPAPTRPGPTTEPKGSVVETTTAKADGGPSPDTTTKPKKNHPLPKGWEPKPETVNKIRTERPDLDLATEHENFCDYWHSITGAKARKADWDATWRVWMRRQKQNTTGQPQKSKSQRYIELGERMARELEAQEAQKPQPTGTKQLEPPF